MGSSESFPATPTCTPLLNKHLKNVRDPRSPTAGIPRTPIEVANSPKDDTPFPKQGELAKSQHENWDPRSPTPGISRTPLKGGLADTISYPAKLFSENVTGENSEEEPPPEEPLQQDRGSGSAFGTEGRTAASAVASGEISLEDSQPAEGENEQSFSMVSVAASTKPVQSARIIHPTGIKSVKRRVSNKTLATPPGAGRSPLSVLQGDNSPISLASHQSKRSSSVTDNQREAKDGNLSSGTNFPADSRGWDVMNKENRQRRWVEN